MPRASFLAMTLFFLTASSLAMKGWRLIAQIMNKFQEKTTQAF
jgi:hypothetical protein